jgi:hypothetical protein
MPWFRLYDNILDNDKLAELPPQTFMWWVRMLAAASRFDWGCGSLPPLRKLAFWCRSGENEVGMAREDLAEAGLLDRDGEEYRIHDWAHWQKPKDATAAERNKRARDAKSEATRNGTRNGNRNADRNAPRNGERNANRNGATRVTAEATDVAKEVSSKNTEQPHPVGGVSGGQTHDPVDLRRLYEVIDEATGGGANYAAMMVNVKAKPWPVSSWIEGWRRVGSMTAKPGAPWPYVVSIIEKWPNGIPLESQPTLKLATTPTAAPETEEERKARLARLEAEEDAIRARNARKGA